MYVSYFRRLGWINNQQAPFWPRVIETKSGQNKMFYPGDSQGRLRAYYPFWERGVRYFVRRFTLELMTICSVFWRIDDSGLKNLQESDR